MSEYDNRPVPQSYLNWLAQGNDPASGQMPVDVFRAWQNIGDDRMNADGSIQGTTGRVNPQTGNVDYKLMDDAGLFGEFMNFAEIPAMFGGAILGVGGLNGLLGGAGAGAGAAGEIAALTGSGGAGGAGIGGFGGFGGAGAGVGAGGGLGGGNMDWLTQLLGETGELGQSAATLEGGFNPAISNAPFWSSLPTGAQNALQAIINPGGATGSGGGNLLTKLLPSALGLLGSSQQNKALEDLVGLQGQNRDALLAFGAPYRQRLAGLYDNPSSFLNSQEVQVPVQQGTNALARALSTQGNPIGSGTALQELQNYSANQLFGRLGQEKDRLAGFGGLTAYNQAGAQQFGNTQAQQALAQGEGNMWNTLGYGLNQVLNPQPTMADIARQFGFGIQGLV